MLEASAGAFLIQVKYRSGRAAPESAPMMRFFVLLLGVAALGGCASELALRSRR
jgi:hypothetical protein